MERVKQPWSVEGGAQRPFATLRRFLHPRTPTERCELCSAELAPNHRHLVDVAARKLICACDACAFLFSHRQGGKYQRVPQRLQFLPDFRLDDAQWEGLGIPIGLAFLFRSTPAGRVVAFYPSPAGTTESLLPLEAWEDLVAENPVLQDLQPDVEALLVNRVGRAREYYRVSIDQCYKLVGLLRTHWRGLSGGPEAWQVIERFFAELKEKSHAGS